MTKDSMTREYFRAHLENMVALAQGAQKHGIDATPAQLVAGVESTLLGLIRTDFPLEHMLQTSDLILHAEGPGVHGDSPALSAFNWLAGNAERVLRRFSGELFDLLDKDARRLGRALDLRLTGMAPGSLYLGLALVDPAPDLIPVADEPVFARLRAALRELPGATRAIGDDAMLPMIAEMLPDVAERDSTLQALHKLSPTGNKGIHTVDLASPGAARGSLSQRERVVLRDALRRPNLANRKRGTFTGHVREIDMDAGRFHLRGVNGIGSLRCVTADLDRRTAKSMIGEYARVTGDYESDRQGRPRLMLVEQVEPITSAEQMGLMA